jgi:hypothetical protein
MTSSPLHSHKWQRLISKSYNNEPDLSLYWLGIDLLTKETSSLKVTIWCISSSKSKSIRGSKLLSRCCKSICVQYTTMLDFNNIGYRGCSYLAKMTWDNLQTLNIGTIYLESAVNNIADKGCRYLATTNWANLQSLHLGIKIATQMATTSATSGVCTSARHNLEGSSTST